MDKEQLIKQVIDAAYVVHKTLHPGFLESVYKKALVCELKERSIDSIMEAPLHVLYKGHNVGDFFVDVLIEGWLIVELKAIENLCIANEVQLVNYLTATNTPTGLLINFGASKLQVKRKYKDHI